ncbi:MAG TPA: pitrilysin family protein [Pyrinomonadaceae bacterium]|jgi:zinc protease
MYKIQNSKFVIQNLTRLSLTLCVFAASVLGQTQTPPTPSAPRAAKIPAVAEKKLANGLRIATAERKNVPLVTVYLSVTNGANAEEETKAGLANLTASMLTKGTKTRTASQIAEQMEFLGGAIVTGAGWNNSVVSVTVMSDKVDAAMAIMADVVLNPKFDSKELDLLKSQTLDGLTYNLKQPGFLANYVASKYAFEEHPAGGTPETIQKITVSDISKFKNENYTPEKSVLIFTGDITGGRASALAQKFFGRWRSADKKNAPMTETLLTTSGTDTQKQAETAQKTLVSRILVVDLPDSGQASVNYAVYVPNGRSDTTSTGAKAASNPYFYSALVMNSVLGGGYSSRLNQEIRIKRGLSYGAGSNFAWRYNSSNFSTATQTKNESAAEVADLVLTEIKKLSGTSVTQTELAPRKLVLTGDFGRELETTQTLAQTIAALYTYNLPVGELNTYIKDVNEVTDDEIVYFAERYINEGNLIIVGDYKIFKDDLAKRFPNTKIDVVKADSLDLSAASLQK